jgi:capsular polysaccharide biosynthesis protein
MPPIHQTFKRRIHDAYAAAATLLGGPPSAARGDGAEQGLETVHVIPGGELRVEHRLEALYHDLPSSFSTLRWPESRLLRLRHASVVGDQGNVFLKDGRWLRACPSLEVLQPRKVRRPLPLGARRTEAPAFHLTGRDHENRAHFLFQHLPRLLACKDAPALPQTLQVIVARGHRRWQEEYLRKLGLSREVSFIESDAGTLRCRELYYVPQIRSGSSPLCRPQDYIHLRERLHRPGPKTGLPVFISRADAPDRHLLNEAEVIASFERVFGSCQVVRLSEIPLDEQIQIFSRAPLVAGSQGQAFSAALFSRHTVFVILEAGEHNPWCGSFRDVAVICGNEALTLYSGTPRQKGQSYVFPLEKLEHAWRKLRPLLASPVFTPA